MSKRRASHAGSWYSANRAELDAQLTRCAPLPPRWAHRVHALPVRPPPRLLLATLGGSLRSLTRHTVPRAQTQMASGCDAFRQAAAGKRRHRTACRYAPNCPSCEDELCWTLLTCVLTPLPRRLLLLGPDRSARVQAHRPQAREAHIHPRAISPLLPAGLRGDRPRCVRNAPGRPRGRRDRYCGAVQYGCL